MDHSIFCLGVGYLLPDGKGVALGGRVLVCMSTMRQKMYRSEILSGWTAWNALFCVVVRNWCGSH